MFPMVVRQESTRFTAPPSDALFPNINGRAFRGDYSFIATLRALLKDRIPDEDNLTMALMERPNFRSEYSNARDFLTHLIGHMPVCEIAIINLGRRGDEAEARVKICDEALSDGGGFSLKSDISLLMEQTKFVEFCRIYVNQKQKACVVVVNTLSTGAWHVLQCLTPRLLPAYFAEKGPTAEELALIGALNTETDEKYLEIINQMAESVDFRGYLIKSVVGNVMTRAAENNIHALENVISSNRSRMGDLMRQYTDLVRTIDRDNATLAGFIIRKNAGAKDEEFLNFLKQMTWFTPVESTSDGFTFLVRTYLDMYDPDMFETMADNDNSHIWEAGYGDGFSDRLDRRLLMNAIFGHDAKFKVNCCAYFNMDTRGAIESWRDYSFPMELRDCIPNPHLNYFNCFGDHRPLITDRIQAGDLMGAVMQCKTSASSINVGEPPTMKNFLEDLFHTTQKCIHLPDGRDVTPIEALNVLKEGSDA